MSGKHHLKRIHALECVVCVHMGLQSPERVEAHHVESIRDETSDYAVVPLCSPHHNGPNGVHGLHRRGFIARYGLSDVDLLGLTMKALEKDGLLI